MRYSSLHKSSKLRRCHSYSVGWSHKPLPLEQYINYYHRTGDWSSLIFCINKKKKQKRKKTGVWNACANISGGLQVACCRNSGMNVYGRPSSRKIVQIMTLNRLAWQARYTAICVWTNRRLSFSQTTCHVISWQRSEWFRLKTPSANTTEYWGYYQKAVWKVTQHTLSRNIGTLRYTFIIRHPDIELSQLNGLYRKTL